MAKQLVKKYTVLMSDETAKKVSSYKQDLVARKSNSGTYLSKVLGKKLLAEMTDEAFLQDILATKKPQIFAESAIRGGGKDWNNQELSILGDISIAVPVTIYDNMGRMRIKIYDKPFNGELLYSPGCLLGGDGFTEGAKAVPDYVEVVKHQTIDQSAYNRLVARRLFPVFKYANDKSTTEQKALITIPGIGCGQFAGRFLGKLGNHLNIALQSLLESYSKDLQNIALVRFDPYKECREYQGAETKYGSITYRVRPLVDNPDKTQLCEAKEYEENQDDFSQCMLFKIVAWDHVSYPGNDYWIGSRNTDDGIAAAATDSMNAFTAEKGHYDKKLKRFVTSNGSDYWEDKAEPLIVRDNLMVIPIY